MLSLEQLRMFVIAADEGSFSACARKTGKVQSAVSHGISTLELDLNVELFDRSSRSPTLTPAGERLLRLARGLLIQADELEKTAQSIYKQQETRLTLAVDDGLLLPEVYDVLKKLQQTFPTVEIEFISLPSTDIAVDVAKGQIDLGIMFSEVEAAKQTDFCYVGNIDYVAVCHPAYPLAAAKDISLTALLPHRQIAVRGREKRESQLLLSIAASTWWCSSYSKVLALVNRQVGWAYLPLFMVEPLLSKGLLCEMQVSFDHATWSVPVDLIYSKGASHGPVFKFLTAELKQLYASLAKR
ncbi:transcriptional regulator [Alishewanella longhuensis]|uniref:Transcriptional regulator n=1 Tax=Alishewanella longhuensis TaxID=1091037 RepID=A0ABQ3KVD8_9ALTE|nr:LysR family transcriptional regulator [Alishewanella longhuensis]GHG63041.1 transcriptional regulator [Alishewanella longhuensis]